MNLERTRECMRHAFAVPSVALVLAVLLIAIAEVAATRAASPPAAMEADPSGSPSAHTPRTAIEGFLERCRERRYAEAASYLDLEQVSPSERASRGPELARHLEIVLDQALSLDPDKLSDAPEGDPQDGLPPGIDRAGVVQTRKGPVDVLLKRVEGPDGKMIWEVAPSTLRRIPALYAEFGYGRLAEILPAWCFDIVVLDVQLWQWAGLVLATLMAWLVAITVVGIVRRMLQPAVRRTRTHLDDRILEMMTPPSRFVIALLLFVFVAAFLKLSVGVQAFLRDAEKGLAIVLGTWILMRLTHVATDLLAERLEREGKRSVVAMMPIARKTAKLALVGMAAVGVLQSVGFNVTGVVAGLGVGGLAVALAAQRTVENLFGGATIAADQPVRVGDFCRWGDKLGTVEDVGLRSTRIRTLDRTVVTVPNSVFSQMEIENFGARDKIRLHATIGLRYETSPDQLRHALIELRKLLVGHPKVDPDPSRVRFVGFGASSLDLEIFAYIRTSDYNEFLKIREDIFLRIMDIVEASGTGFAFPSQTVYFGRDGGLDPEKSRAAENGVRARRDRGELPFPDLPDEMVTEIQDALDYPPKGSAVRS